MGATINVNDKTVVHKGSGGIATSFPDVCKTPTPGGPVPIPYPNIAKSADTAQGSQTVKMDGNPIMLKGSIYSTSSGDEAGTAGGVVSSCNKGKAEFLMYSFDVKADGKNVCRLGDLMGQNESSLNIGGFPTVQSPLMAKGMLKRRILTGHVIEITLDSGINLHKDQTKAAVPPAGKPHFKKGMGFATYPAVYLMQSAGGKKALQVKIRITDLENLSGSGELAGEGGGIKVKPKTFPLEKDKDIILDMEFDTVPDEAVYFRQGILWTVKAASRFFPFGGTRLNIFFLYVKPKDPWTGTPVWQNVLELLFLKAGVRGNLPIGAVRKITQYCHGFHGCIYDTEGGSPAFSERPPGTMKLSEYLKALKVGDKRKVNCYDQAYAVITLAAALGIETSWVFMQPYGFINVTNLVGVGSCNNPFFDLKDPRVMRPPLIRGGPPLPGSPKVPAGTLPFDDPKAKPFDGGRTGFWNHAFVNYQGKIYDACAGPHKGTESPDAYADQAIDVSKDYYSYSWTSDPHKPHGSDMDPPVPGYVTKVV